MNNGVWLPSNGLIDTLYPQRTATACVQRMHVILRDCDNEMALISDATNTHGRKSEPFKAAVKKLEACQRRRVTEFTTIEARCGPAQAAYKSCLAELGPGASGKEYTCLPVLHSFLDCAERALNPGQGSTST